MRFRSLLGGTMISSVALWCTAPLAFAAEDEKDPLTKNPIVFMDIEIGGNYGELQKGRVTFELYANKYPKTAENFRCLCTGEKGSAYRWPFGSAPLHYKGSRFHRIVPGVMVMGGDIVHGNGVGGVSIYGNEFGNETKRSEDMGTHGFGTLSMTNTGRRTQHSQFFICLDPVGEIGPTGVPLGTLDGKHVVVGRVLTGFELIGEMQKTHNVFHSSCTPKREMTVVDCGQLQ